MDVWPFNLSQAHKCILCFSLQVSFPWGFQWHKSIGGWVLFGRKPPLSLFRKQQLCYPGVLGVYTVPPLIAASHRAEMHLLAGSSGRHKSMGGCQLLIVTVLQNECCFNILYRFLCNTLTCARQPRARINSAQRIPSPYPFVKSQSCFNDAWRNIQALTFHCQVSLEKSIKIIQLWPSYPVNAY